MAGYRNGFIVLDSPRDVFYPGQMVNGSVVFEIEQSLSLAVLHVDYIGEAKVIWNEQESEEHNGVTRYKKVEYKGKEDYFNFRQILAGGNAPVSLPPGTHTYQFSYQIPPGVPSSFSGERGGITYCVKATIELRSREVFHEVLTKYFEVVAPFDLNLGSPKLKEPIDLEIEEVVGCSCFSSSPINIRARMPFSGYCPGQVVPVALEVNNNSSVEIRAIIFQILTRERYRTQRPVSEYVPPERVLATVAKGTILSGAKKNVTVDVKLPELIAPNLENCGIIDVGYFFKITIKLSGCNDDLEDEAEFCLGLVPLNETLDGEYVHPFTESLPIGPIPDIPVEHEQSREVPNQQSGYPGQVPNPEFPNLLSGFADLLKFPIPAGFPNTTVEGSSYFVQVQERQYSSTDPSKNYNIGFTMTSPPGGQMNFASQNWTQHPPNKDLKIHLPQPSVNVNVPSAPPLSS